MAFRFRFTASDFFIICLMLVQIESDQSPNYVSLKSACQVTLDPKFCVSTMSSMFPGSLRANSTDITRMSIELSVIEARRVSQIISRLQQTSKGKQLRALEDCMELNDLTLDYLSNSLSNVTDNSLKWRQSVDTQTWLSAALTNQGTCVESLQEASGSLQDELTKSVQNISRVVSNSLALVKRISVVGKDSRRPPGHNRRLFSNPTIHERHNQVDVDDDKIRSHNGVVNDGFPSWLSASDRRRLLQTSKVADNVVTVAQDGTGNYTTITDALNAAPNNSLDRYVIHITKGVYREYVEVPKHKKNIMLLGDGINATVITGNRSSGVDAWTTYSSATVAVVAQGFLARAITFENTAGPEKNQSVALRVGSDLSIFYNCSFKGYQDTLYVHTLRQFYRECDIYGTVDFIFGNAAVVFQKCNLLARKPMDSQKNSFTAQGRDDPNQNTGISIQNCNVSAAPDLAPVKSSFQTFLGRPWKNYSRTVYMKCNIDDVVDPAGWLEWQGNPGRSNTLYYGEYMNSGPGAGTAERVQWPGYHIMNISDAQNFTVVNFISGDAWIQNVPFDAGL